MSEATQPSPLSQSYPHATTVEDVPDDLSSSSVPYSLPSEETRRTTRILSDLAHQIETWSLGPLPPRPTQPSDDDNRRGSTSTIPIPTASTSTSASASASASTS